MTEDKEIHLVKKVSKELGLTYQELGDEIGYSESTLRRSVSKNQLSGQLKKAIELYLKIIELKEKEEKSKKQKDLIEAYSIKILQELDSKREIINK